jgi:hypothetical protein
MSCFQVELIENNFQIVNKDSDVVPYELWGHQRDVIELIASAEPGSGFLIHKAASLGMSSCMLAFAMAEAISRANQNIVLLTHEENLSKRLLRRSKTFVEYAMSQNVFGVTMTRTPQDEIEFSNKSLISIATAGSTTSIGRGDPFSMMICSEIGFYRNAGVVMTAMLPRAKRATKIFESTGNGAQGWFYKQCTKAWDGKSGYYFYFVPWFKHSEYTKDRPGKVSCVIDDLSQDEIDLKEDFGVTDGQLLWRRETISELDNDEETGMSGEESFKQEYPCTSIEGFLRTGSPVFGHKVNQILEETVCSPVFLGDINL